jgi:hypothetical protein
LTPHKSTGGRVSTRQLAPRHHLEDVEEELEEIQPEAENEEAPEEVQPEPVEEEDLEEVEMEELVEPPQLYDGTVMEADADGDLVIPLAPVEEDDAPPTPVEPAPNAVGGDLDDSGDDSGMRMKMTTMLMKTLRRTRILAIMEPSSTNTPLRRRMVSSVFLFVRYCSTWGTP